MTTTLDPSAIAFFSYLSSTLHLVAELLGADAGGYSEAQGLSLFGDSNTCATSRIKMELQYQKWVLLPAVIPTGVESSTIGRILGAVSLLLGGMMVHGIAVLVVWALLNCADSDDTEEDPSPSNLELAQSLTRYPSLTFTWSRLVFLFVVSSALYALSSGGMTAGDGMLGTALLLMMIVISYLMWRGGVHMNLLWLKYKESLADYRAENPMAKYLLPSGSWYDETLEAKQFSSSVAASRPRSVIFLLIWRPTLLFIEGIMAGINFRHINPNACWVSYAIPGTFRMLDTAALVLFRPLRHPIANYCAVCRNVGYFLFLLSQMHPVLIEDLQAAAVGIFIALNLISSVLLFGISLLEVGWWSPEEYEARWAKHGEDWVLQASELENDEDQPEEREGPSAAPTAFATQQISVPKPIEATFTSSGNASAADTVKNPLPGRGTLPQATNENDAPKKEVIEKKEETQPISTFDRGLSSSVVPTIEALRAEEVAIPGVRPHRLSLRKNSQDEELSPKSSSPAAAVGVLSSQWGKLCEAKDREIETLKMEIDRLNRRNSDIDAIELKHRKKELEALHASPSNTPTEVAVHQRLESPAFSPISPSLVEFASSRHATQRRVLSNESGQLLSAVEAGILPPRTQRQLFANSNVASPFSPPQRPALPRQELGYLTRSTSIRIDPNSFVTDLPE